MGSDFGERYARLLAAHERTLELLEENDSTLRYLAARRDEFVEAVETEGERELASRHNRLRALGSDPLSLALTSDGDEEVVAGLLETVDGPLRILLAGAETLDELVDDARWEEALERELQEIPHRIPFLEWRAETVTAEREAAYGRAAASRARVRRDVEAVRSIRGVLREDPSSVLDAAEPMIAERFDEARRCARDLAEAAVARMVINDSLLAGRQRREEAMQPRQRELRMVLRGLEDVLDECGGLLVSLIGEEEVEPDEETSPLVARYRELYRDAHGPMFELLADDGAARLAEAERRAALDPEEAAARRLEECEEVGIELDVDEAYETVADGLRHERSKAEALRRLADVLVEDSEFYHESASAEAHRILSDLRSLRDRLTDALAEHRDASE